MLGSIIGDVVGSRYEFMNIKSKDFELYHPVSTYTDDSVCTIAVAKTLLDNYPIDYSEKGLNKIKEDLVNNLVEYVHKYPYSGYGGRFNDWAWDEERKPYNSFGNGSGMRVSPVGWIGKSEEEIKKLAKATAEVTHNHPEGIKGAEAVAMCIFMARNNKSKEEIKEYVIKNYYPEVNDLDYEELVKFYRFNETCQGSVPQAIYCFLISNNFIDAIKTAVSIGGDSDTIADMTGAIAEAYYKDKEDLEPIIKDFYKQDKLPKDFIEVIDTFNKVVLNKS